MSEFEGFLFIGDPHITQRTPGNRVESDFLAVSLAKLGRALAVAAAERLYPVILGDLFDRPTEDGGRRRNNAVLLGVLDLLAPWKQTPPVCLVGNHDSDETGLAPDSNLAVCRQVGALRVQTESGVIDRFVFGGCRVLLGGSAYGFPPPLRVVRRNCDVVFWITHHDFAIGHHSYPGIEPVFEIEGCDFVVNGHLHLTADPVRAGSTLWFNPGNILRMSRDAAGHVPSVWSWRPGEATLTRHVLEYERNVFLEAGLDAAAKRDHVARLRRENSLFSGLLKETAEKSCDEDGRVFSKLAEDLLDETGDMPADARELARALVRAAARSA